MTEQSTKLRDDDAEEFEVDVRDDEGDEDEGTQPKPKAEAADPDDSDDDDDEDGGEEPAASDGDDPVEAERKREERRQLRAERRRANRQRRREEEARERAEREEMRRELAEARQQLSAQNARNLQQDARQLDQEVQQSTDAYNYWAQQRAKAITEQNAQLFDQAEKGMHAAGQRVAQLRGIQQRIAPQLQQIQQQKPAQGQAPQAAAEVQLTQRGKQLASEFLENIRGWYDPDGKDEDSDIVNTIDRRLIHVEGFSPNSEDYYRELKKRLEGRLPHRFAKTGERRSPPTGGARTHSDGARRVTVDKATWDAWTEAGYTEDPVRLQNMVKRYRAQQNSR